MRVGELAARRVAVWGLGREGRAAVTFLRRHHSRMPLLMLDDAADGQPLDELGAGIDYAFGADRIAKAIEQVDVIVKSPGVSLYRQEIQAARGRGIAITSLLNLWFAEHLDVMTICVTGTKGKSTTASLIAHIMKKLGRQVALVGNIGVPITAIDNAAEFAVIEVSSYQAADFDGLCDVAVLTSLFPEHIDWHLSVENYFRDKANLLCRGRSRIINGETAGTVEPLIGGATAGKDVFNEESGIHSCGMQILDGGKVLGQVSNRYLARPHNRSNLCAALTVAKSLELDPAAALEAAGGFCGLPHRQQELGEVAGLLFVDDSISTIPESTVAALAVYADRDVAVIVGGYDRGIDYGKLVESVMGGAAKAIICLGDSGQRIYSLARNAASRGQHQGCAIHHAKSMEDAVSFARQVTPPGGVVLLSPAAPSYDQFRDYIARGRDFAAKAGLPTSTENGSHSRPE